MVKWGWDVFKEYTEQSDPNFNKSLDVKTTEYPNYDVLPDYRYQQEVFDGFGLLVGAGYGFFIAFAIAVPYSHWKYKRLGYRDFYLLEKLCMPLVKSTAFGSIVGLGVGGALEMQRVANREVGRAYNSKT